MLLRSGLLALAFLVSASLAEAQSGASLVCQDVRQRFMVEESRLNQRSLNFLFFDAAERGCMDLVEKFLTLGASISARDRVGNTALLLAARAGKRRIISRLLEEGSAVDHRNLAGTTALLHAAGANRRAAVKLFLKAGADPDRANKRGVTPIMAAAFNGNKGILELLLDGGADATLIDVTGKSALIYAAGRGFATVAERLLAKGVEIDQRGGNDLTALMWAAGHSNDVPAADALKTLDLLLAGGAEFNLVDDRGRSALMIAAERGHATVVGRLLEAGADPALRDAEGLTALELAGNDQTQSLLAEVR